jgi:hypothetical protein
MTLTSLQDDWVPLAGAGKGDLISALGTVIDAFDQQGKEEGLAIDWSTFSVEPDVQEFEYSTASKEATRTERYVRLRFGVVAAKVEDD